MPTSGNAKFATKNAAPIKSVRRFCVYLGFAASRSGALSVRIGDAIPKFFDAIMRFLNTSGLSLDQGARLGAKLLLVQGLAIIVNRRILTSLAFRKHGMRFIGREGRFQINPSAVQCAADRAVFIGITAKRSYELLHLADVITPLCRVLREHSGKFRVFRVLRRCRVSLLSVFAGLDQVVQNANRFFVESFHGIFALRMTVFRWSHPFAYYVPANSPT